MKGKRVYGGRLCTVFHARRRWIFSFVMKQESKEAAALLQVCFLMRKMCFGLVAGRTGKGLETTKLSGILIGVLGDRHRRAAV